MKRLLELFAGSCSVSKAFAVRGWTCTCVDLLEPPEIPDGCQFIKADVLQMACQDGAIWWQDGLKRYTFGVRPDFIWASSPCEEFSVHGMKHFHPNPKYPAKGIRLFNHTRQLCEDMKVPYIMENVRPAQKFVGAAVHHCGPFYLWGTGVPPLIPKGITKGIDIGSPTDIKKMTKEERRIYRKQFPWTQLWSSQRGQDTAKAATIPPELANCVADYAERLRELKCRADSDGDCFWKDCPQMRDEEPRKSERHCPLDLQR